MNPIDLLSGRHRELRKARERVAKTQEALRTERQRLTDLKRELGPAEARDRKALAAALVDGQKEPVAAADGLRLEIEQQQRRVDAVVEALSEARVQVDEVAREHRGDWSREQAREVSRASARYREAIEELEAARDALAAEVGAYAWLLDPEGGQSSPANAALAGRSGSRNGRPPLTIVTVLEELREDLQAIDGWVVTRSHPPRCHGSS